MTTVPPQPGPAGQSPYGAPPQPAAGPSAAPGTDLGSDLGAALSFAGRSLLRNPAAFLVSGLIWGLVLLVVTAGAVGGMMAFLFASVPDDPSAEPSVGLFVGAYAILFGILLLMVPFMLLWEAGSGRSGEIILGGGRPTIGQVLVGPGRLVPAASLAGLSPLTGPLLFPRPGIVAAVALFYAIPASVRGASPVEAMKQSVALVRANLATTIVAWLVVSVISSVAGMFVITVIVLVPFLVLFQLGMFERLHGRALPEPRGA